METVGVRDMGRTNQNVECGARRHTKWDLTKATAHHSGGIRFTRRAVLWGSLSAGRRSAEVGRRSGGKGGGGGHHTFYTLPPLTEDQLFFADLLTGFA